MGAPGNPCSRRAYLASVAAAAAVAAPNAEHEAPMRRAIELAANAPDFPFAAVLVDRRTKKIVAEGWNRSGLDPTFHGEMDVIHHCARRHSKIDWTQLALYTTAEPCPMCQGAVAWTGISLVAYGTSIPYLQKLNWWQIDLRAEEVRRRTPFRQCTLVAGVLERECNALFDAAWRRAQKKDSRGR